MRFASLCKRTLMLLAGVGVCTTTVTDNAARADDSLVTTCIAHVPGWSVVARFEAMRQGDGTVAIDGATGTRRLHVKTDFGPTQPTPGGGHVTTFALLFSGYDRGDRRPDGERLTTESVVGLIMPVPPGPMRLYFGGDFKPPFAVGSRGYLTCE